jgi:hypothetical protein
MLNYHVKLPEGKLPAILVKLSCLVVAMSTHFRCWKFMEQSQGLLGTFIFFRIPLFLYKHTPETHGFFYRWFTHIWTKKNGSVGPMMGSSNWLDQINSSMNHYDSVTSIKQSNNEFPNELSLHLLFTYYSLFKKKSFLSQWVLNSWIIQTCHDQNMVWYGHPAPRKHSLEWMS